jgi:hypothetical protein
LFIFSLKDNIILLLTNYLINFFLKIKFNYYVNNCIAIRFKSFSKAVMAKGKGRRELWDFRQIIRSKFRSSSNQSRGYRKKN